MQVLTEEEKRQLVAEFVKALESRRSIPESEHQEHHKIIADWLESRQRRRVVIHQWILKPAVGLLTVTGLAYVGYFLKFIGELVIQYLQTKGGA